MQAIDVIRQALVMSDQGFCAIVSDMRDAALMTSTPGAKGGHGNHTLWNVGHQAFIEGFIHHAITGKPHEFSEWASFFGTGTVSEIDAAKYPSFDEVLAKYKSVRARSLTLLDELGPEALDRKPAVVPPGFEDAMSNIGNTFLLCTLHQMVHYGQIADCRRVAGRKPLF
jgi:hypothetical protein